LSVSAANHCFQEDINIMLLFVFATAVFSQSSYTSLTGTTQVIPGQNYDLVNTCQDAATTSWQCSQVFDLQAATDPTLGTLSYTFNASDTVTFSVTISNDLDTSNWDNDPDLFLVANPLEYDTWFTSPTGPIDLKMCSDETCGDVDDDGVWSPNDASSFTSSDDNKNLYTCSTGLGTKRYIQLTASASITEPTTWHFWAGIEKHGECWWEDVVESWGQLVTILIVVCVVICICAGIIVCVCMGGTVASICWCCCKKDAPPQGAEMA